MNSYVYIESIRPFGPGFFAHVDDNMRGLFDQWHATTLNKIRQEVVELFESYKEYDEFVSGEDVVATTDSVLYRLLLDNDIDAKLFEKPNGKQRLMFNEAKRRARCSWIGVSGDIHTLKSEQQIQAEGGRIRGAKLKAFWAAARSSEYRQETIYKLLFDHGVISAKDITNRDYREIMDKISSPTIAKVLNARSKARY